MSERWRRWGAGGERGADGGNSNVHSCFIALRHASEAMKVTSAGKKESGGSIIMTASVAGLRSGAGSVDYSASKASVISMAATGAWQLAKTNIRVNAICPGLIETGMTAPTFEMARARGSAVKIGQLNPTGRYGVAEEVRWRRKGRRGTSLTAATHPHRSPTPSSFLPPTRPAMSMAWRFPSMAA